jgi:uncharacterized protein GlcG (DUF336 family)
MGLPTSVMAERVERLPQPFTALASVSAGRIVPAPGGVLVRRDGAIVGAVGVSGDVFHVDEEAAIHGVAGLQADHGQVEEWRRP